MGFWKSLFNDGPQTCAVYKPLLIPLLIICFDVVTVYAWTIESSMLEVLSHSVLLGGLSVNVWLLIQLAEQKTANQRNHDRANKNRERIESALAKKENIKIEEVTSFFSECKMNKKEGFVIIIVFLLFLIGSFLMIISLDNCEEKHKEFIHSLGLTFFFFMGIIVPGFLIGGKFSFTCSIQGD